jgi:hypothetical protein
LCRLDYEPLRLCKTIALSDAALIPAACNRVWCGARDDADQTTANRADPKWQN